MGGSGAAGHVVSGLVAGSQVGSFINRGWWVRERRTESRDERDQHERWKEMHLLLRIFTFPQNLTALTACVFQVVSLHMFHFSFICGSLRGFLSFQP